ncbi:hypothetical protein D172_015470 [Pseudoalteromonas sp. Bsw20308]|nr:hypothetical protein D172_015470 [Pseudoalteromonas sp. Bsw20308]ATG76463.1 hypothetical protein AOR04_02290 [Pseudoalteromonas sp. 1_2015MBL_MicDiv]
MLITLNLWAKNKLTAILSIWVQVIVNVNLYNQFFITVMWQIYDLYPLLLPHKALNATFGSIFFVKKIRQKLIKSKRISISRNNPVCKCHRKVAFFCSKFKKVNFSKITGREF